MIENSRLYSYLCKVLAGIFDLIPVGLLGRVWAVKCTDYAAAFEANTRAGPLDDDTSNGDK